jgi:hypothetical protein
MRCSPSQPTRRRRALPNYFISYDLRKPGQNYQPLWDALRRMGATRRLESVWVVTLQATGQTKAIFSTLNPQTDTNNGLLVLEELDGQDWSKNLRS